MVKENKPQRATSFPTSTTGDDADANPVPVIVERGGINMSDEASPVPSQDRKTTNAGSCDDTVPATRTTAPISKESNKSKIIGSSEPGATAVPGTASSSDATHTPMFTPDSSPTSRATPSGDSKAAFRSMRRMNNAEPGALAVPSTALFADATGVSALTADSSPANLGTPGDSKAAFKRMRSNNAGPGATTASSSVATGTDILNPDSSPISLATAGNSKAVFRSMRSDNAGPGAKAVPDTASSSAATTGANTFTLGSSPISLATAGDSKAPFRSTRSNNAGPGVTAVPGTAFSSASNAADTFTTDTSTTNHTTPAGDSQTGFKSMRSENAGSGATGVPSAASSNSATGTATFNPDSSPTSLVTVSGCSKAAFTSMRSENAGPGATVVPGTASSSDATATLDSSPTHLAQPSGDSKAVFKSMRSENAGPGATVVPSAESSSAATTTLDSSPTHLAQLSGNSKAAFKSMRSENAGPEATADPDIESSSAATTPLDSAPTHLAQLSGNSKAAFKSMRSEDAGPGTTAVPGTESSSAATATPESFPTQLAPPSADSKSAFIASTTSKSEIGSKYQSSGSIQIHENTETLVRTMPMPNSSHEVNNSTMTVLPLNPHGTDHMKHDNDPNAVSVCSEENLVSGEEKKADLPEAAPVFESTVVVDQDELDAQAVRRLLANVGEAQVLTEVSAHGNDNDLRRETNQKSLARRLACSVGVVSLLVAVSIAAVCGSGNCSLTERSLSPPLPPSRPPSADTPAPTAISWSQVVVDSPLLPLADSVATTVKSGMFGSMVSMSDDGSKVAVTFGEEQRVNFRRRHLQVGIFLKISEIFDCNATSCTRVLDIDASEEFVNATVSLSGSGSRAAVAYTPQYPSADPSAATAATLTVYSIEENSTMVPLGAFPPEAGATNIVARLSYSGDVLATLSWMSKLTVFQYSEDVDVWQQFEGHGEQPSEKSVAEDGMELVEEPMSLSLSGAGTMVAVGSNTVPFQEIPSLCPGRSNGYGYIVRVYALLATQQLRQVGSDIVSGAGKKRETLASRESIALSGDGRVLAIGASQEAVCSSRDRGLVRILRLSAKDGKKWLTLGNSIFGSDGETFGASVALNGDGTVVSIGAPDAAATNGLNSGRVVVYKYSRDTDLWVQVGQDISGAVGSSFGHSLALSSDGGVLAVGAPQDRRRGENSGSVGIFQTIGV